jgi:predicted TIM-barrel fold metal-dependent hydrolase
MDLNIPLDAWDTHLHVYDQAKFPFRSDRHYTPQSVNLDDALASVLCTNLVLVQASFEDGWEGILVRLQEAQRRFPDCQVRAEIIWDSTNEVDITVTERLHRLGVRCLRIHGEDGHGNGNNLEWVQKNFQVASMVADRHGWAVAAQLPLSTWLALSRYIDHRQSASPVIVEHLGSPPPTPLTAEQVVEFNTFVNWAARNPQVFVKISGLYRRVGPGESIESVSHMIKQLATQVPHALLYGSDYPHVDVETKSSNSTLLLEVDRVAELSVIKDCVGAETWRRILVDNPARIFL